MGDTQCHRKEISSGCMANAMGIVKVYERNAEGAVPHRSKETWFNYYCVVRKAVTGVVWNVLVVCLKLEITNDHSYHRM